MADESDLDLSSEFRATIEKEMGGTFVEFPPIPQNMPAHIDLEKFPENDRELVAECVSVVRSFIHMPLLVDKFTDHDEREDKRMEMYDVVLQKYGKEQAETFNVLATTNKLKRNQIAHIVEATDLYETFVTKTATEAGTLIKRIFNEKIAAIKGPNDPQTGQITVIDQWAQKDLDEKKQILAELTAASVDFLNEVASY